MHKIKDIIIIILCLVLVSPITKAETLQNKNWVINAWGRIPSTSAFKEVDYECGKLEERDSSSFVVNSRSDGDSELILPSLLEPRKSYKFGVWLKSKYPVTVELYFRNNAFPFETSIIKSVKISDWQFIELEGIYNSNKLGSVRLSVKKLNNPVCINGAKLEVLDSKFIWNIENSNLINSTYFGIHLNRLGVHNSWPQFNTGTLRLWDSGTTWALIQPENKPIDWEKNNYASRLDYYVNHGLQNNKNLQFIYTLGMTPNWAANKIDKSCNNSEYGTFSCLEPKDIEDWRKYIRELGIRYKGKIQVWEVWNEADIWINWNQKADKILPLVKIAYEELKSIDPNNKIIGPNITSLGLKFLNDFLDCGGGAYIDGISVHAYSGRNPDLSFNFIHNIQQILHYHGLEKMPIWNTESNVSCVQDCENITNNSDVLSGENSLAQGLIGNAALGVVNYSYYTWEGSSQNYGGLPLVEKDFITPTKLGKVYQTIENWLLNSHLKFISNNEGIKVVEVEKNGTLSYVFWSENEMKDLNLNSIIELNNTYKINRWIKLTDLNSHILESNKIKLDTEPVMLYYEEPENN